LKIPSILDEDAIYVELEDHWQCEACGNKIQKGIEWDNAKICPQCHNKIWFDDIEQANNYSNLF